MHRLRPMLRIALTLSLGSLLCACESGPKDAQGERSDPETLSIREAGWKTRTLDELIDALPDVDLERWRSLQGEGLITHPAVAELRRRMDRGALLSDEQWLRALTGSGAIRWRTSWPEGEPFAISLRKPRWADIPRMRVVPRHPDLVEATCGLHFAMCGLAHDNDAQRAFHSRLGRLAAGRHELSFDIVVEARHRTSRNSKDPSLWEGRLTLEVDVVPGLDAILPPRSAPELHAALRDLIRLERVSEGGTRARLFLGDASASREALAETALTLEVELLHAGSVVESHPPTEPERDWITFGRRQDLPPEFHHLALLERLPAPGQNLAGWTLRLRGVERDALRWWGTSARFAGILEVPLADLLGP